MSDKMSWHVGMASHRSLFHNLVEIFFKCEITEDFIEDMIHVDCCQDNGITVFPKMPF